ncbi:MAG: cyclic nucleotide-binding domain-containing protein [Chlamydiae bacterium]|nr:cyclic nucleotide-binding domain-containing protein [Chlamydiota bacterium]
MKSISDIVKEHPFFGGLDPKDLEFISGCGKNVVFKEGQIIAHPGQAADIFYLLKEGDVAIYYETPIRKPIIYHTLQAGELLGLSWLIPPYRWTVSAKARSTTRAIAIDGACLREKCEKDPYLGYLLMKRLISVLLKREESLRLHLLDVFSVPD